MIHSYSTRDHHPQDQRINAWYRSRHKSERSREYREAMIMYLDRQQIGEEGLTLLDASFDEHVVQHGVIETGGIELKKVDLVRKDDDDDLDSKLNTLGTKF